MLTDITIVYTEPEEKERILNAEFSISPFFRFIKENTRHGKKEAYTLKTDFGAKLSPFIVCYNKDVAKKAFYSEASKDVIEDFINYLKDYKEEPNIIQL